MTATTVTVPEFDRLRQYVRTAIDSGLGAPTVEQYLERMGFNPGDYRPISQDFEHLSSISRSDAKRLRLRYADQLEWEVNALTTERSPARPAVTRSKVQRRLSTL